MGGPAAGAAPFGLQCRVPRQVSKRGKPWVGDVRTMRGERAGEPVAGERTHQASPPLRSGAHSPIIQRCKLNPTTALPCRAEKVRRSEVTSPEVGNLFIPERRLNWGGISPGPFFAAVVSAGRLGLSPLTTV